MELPVTNHTKLAEIYFKLKLSIQSLLLELKKFILKRIKKS